MNTQSNKDESEKTPAINLVIGLAIIALGIYMIFAEYVDFPLPGWSTSSLLIILGFVGIVSYYITRQESKVITLSSLLLCSGLFMAIRDQSFLYPRYGFRQWTGWEGWVIALGAGFVLAFLLSRGRADNITSGLVMIALATAYIFLQSPYDLALRTSHSWVILPIAALIAVGVSYILKAIMPYQGANDE